MPIAFIPWYSSNQFITFMKSSELLRLLKRDGWFEVRQKGSHIIMRHPVKPDMIPVPFHASKEMPKGTLRQILKMAGIKTDKR
jgi:predicted RNA binding protein YcfA (HicA-like mRNA interferase family)